MSDLASLFGGLAGERVPGGCDRCSAYQTVTEDERDLRVWHLVVHHDEDCPVARTIRAGMN